jgi:hypothetical protein
MTGIAKAQTIKQAKASYASRGRPSLNAKEQKQLERSLELEQRAEKAKEQEKRRAAAAKKRAENENRSKAERERSFLGTQRRKDRFGYVSSQFHLGAFLVGGGMGGKSVGEDDTVMREEDFGEEDDLFGDEELDDQDMLNALDVPVTGQMSEHAKSDSAVFMPPPPVPPTIRRSQSAPVLEDMGDFWDDLESSTQIARELGDDAEVRLAEKTTSTRSASFGSGEFDLTAEDLDQLDPPEIIQQEFPSAKTAMSPPAPVLKQVAKAISAPPQSPSPNIATYKPAPRYVPHMPPPARPITTMPPPARPVPTVGLSAKPAVKPTTSNSNKAQIFPIGKEPQQTSVSKARPPPPPRRPQDTAPQQTNARNAIKGEHNPSYDPHFVLTLTRSIPASLVPLLFSRPWLYPNATGEFRRR